MKTPCRRFGVLSQASYMSTRGCQISKCALTTGDLASKKVDVGPHAISGNATSRTSRASYNLRMRILDASSPCMFCIVHCRLPSWFPWLELCFWTMRSASVPRSNKETGSGIQNHFVFGSPRLAASLMGQGNKNFASRTGESCICVAEGIRLASTPTSLSGDDV
jgi:hypothetical protein